MKIAFTGAHRVGKTTLAEKIADTLPTYDLNTEPYVQLEEMGYVFTEIPTVDDYIDQFNFSVKQIAASGNDVIFDRCPLDLLAYIFAQSGQNNLQKLYDKMIKAMSQIDLIIFVPIESPDLIICPESDLPNLRLEINEIIQGWIGDLSNEIIEVSGTLENRKKQILNLLDIGLE